MSTHTPLTINKFKGLYTRGTVDSVPRGYFQDCLNVKYIGDEVWTREGSELFFTKANIRRVFVYKRLDETVRYLVLDTSGNFYDSLYPSTPLITNASFLDFSAVSFYNRAYITFHNRTVGVTGSSVYVYQGAGPGTLRFAAGSAPTGFTITAVASATSGKVEDGIHLIAVANESDTGFISAPGPSTFTEYTASGDKQIDLSGIAVGPSGTSARRILATKSIPASLYTGNQLGYAFYFVPNGRIANNTDTTITVNFYDADLVDSADYLFDNLALVPAGVGIGVFGDRLAIWGVPGQEHNILFSHGLDPESFDQTAGFVTTDPSESRTGIRNCTEFRNSFYIFKPNRCYLTSDNGQDPNTWAVNVLDKSVGTQVFGVSKILDSKGASAERYYVADSSGFMLFEGGVFRKPELSANIKDTWDRINKLYIDKIQVVDDPDNYRIYILAPLDDATECSHILVMDYRNSFYRDNMMWYLVRWSIWTFGNNSSAPSSIFTDIYTTTNESVLRFAALAGNIYTIREGLYLDAGSAFLSYVYTGLINVVEDWVNHFARLVFRITGLGNLTLTLTGEDASNTQNLPVVALSTAPGKEYGIEFNFVNEKMAVKIATDGTANSRFKLSKLTVYAKGLWKQRVG